MNEKLSIYFKTKEELNNITLKMIKLATKTKQMQEELLNDYLILNEIQENVKNIVSNYLNIRLGVTKQKELKKRLNKYLDLFNIKRLDLFLINNGYSIIKKTNQHGSKKKDIVIMEGK